MNHCVNVTLNSSLNKFRTSTLKVININELIRKNIYQVVFFLSLLSFATVLAKDIEIHEAVRESRMEFVQLEISNATSNVQETPDYEVAKNKTTDMSMKHHEIKYINKTNDKSDADKRRKGNKFYLKDYGSDYIKTRYIMHKLFNETGQRLSAKQRANLVSERCHTFLKENNLRLKTNTELSYNTEFGRSRSYNLTLCYNFKVASTNTNRVLYVLDHNYTGDINNLTAHMVDRYSKKCMTNFQQIMCEKHRISVMMVREPLERLLSAYRDRRPLMFFKDRSISFKKYLQLTLDEQMINMNRHIYPYFEKCRPCEMEYDFIGLANHFNDDIREVLQHIGASGKVDIPKRNETGYTLESSDKLLKLYFNEVPNGIIHKLWEKYYKDYYIFGFPYPSHMMN
ncbi:carbohydrate sulfotransferase 11-like [Mercenaria mercenaria]|uniref:carbohydrate sulfotransferase 11-like n=1 Tax=Mercenaria mercenaria TaxID=6596 RepID=UPI001E1E22C7|nr:carbohydrate sulfotransferase 11-like [Mercenaria mercenaria]